MRAFFALVYLLLGSTAWADDAYSDLVWWTPWDAGDPEQNYVGYQAVCSREPGGYYDWRVVETSRTIFDIQQTTIPIAQVFYGQRPEDGLYYCALRSLTTAYAPDGDDFLENDPGVSVFSNPVTVASCPPTAPPGCEAGCHQ